jgi:hypothetical protein
MSHILFELLENSGFIKGTTLNADKIGRAKRSNLIDICLQSAELRPVESRSNPRRRQEFPPGFFRHLHHARAKSDGVIKSTARALPCAPGAC